MILYLDLILSNCTRLAEFNIKTKWSSKCDISIVCLSLFTWLLFHWALLVDCFNSPAMYFIFCVSMRMSRAADDGLENSWLLWLCSNCLFFGDLDHVQIFLNRLHQGKLQWFMNKSTTFFSFCTSTSGFSVLMSLTPTLYIFWLLVWYVTFGVKVFLGQQQSHNCLSWRLKRQIRTELIQNTAIIE